jgi:hypothetical protein
VADESTTPEVEFVKAELTWFAEDVQLDLTQNGESEPDAGAASAPPAAAASDRAAQLESDHWRERAVLWRERALAAELVVKMLQRNLDDLRANLEDLRIETQELAEGQVSESAARRSPAAMPPWRRFMRDLYDKYLR